MKILFVAPAYPLRGGIAQFTALLFNRIKERGHSAKIISFKRQYPKIFFPGKTQLESGPPTIPVESEPIIDSLNPFSWIKAAFRIRKYKPNMLIFMFWMPFFAPCYGSICWLIKLFNNIKILYICHNIIPHEKKLGDIALTRYAFKKADYFIVQSDVVKQDLLKIIPEANYKKIPHPLYDIFGEACDKNKAKKEIGLYDKRIILFFGYVRAYKGLDLILKAMPEILKSINVKLAVVGEFYEQEENYRKLLKELNIEKNVFIHSNFIANEKVNLYFSASDVVVLPYKSATQSGIVPLAYHLNKPCIVTDVGGLAEVVVHNKTGFVVKSQDPKELANAVIRFYLENKEEEFSKNINDEKKIYSWENLISAIESFVN